MKPIPFLSLSLFIHLAATGQYINNISIYPQAPVSTDTIYIYPTVSFGAGSCDAHTQFITINGNSIQASATHCTGFLTVVCTTTDTFKIEPLADGNYTFYFNLNQGAYPAPCIPGIAPGPADSLKFTVSSLSSIVEKEAMNKSFLIYPNPASDYFTISFKNKHQKRTVKLMTAEGKLVGNYENVMDVFRLDTGSLLNGIYIIGVTENNKIEKQLVTIQK